MSGPGGQRIKSWNPTTNTLKDVEHFSLLHGETALAALARFSISTPNLYKIQQSKMGPSPPDLQTINGFATKFRSRIDKALAVCENLFLSNVREMASVSQQNNLVPPVESTPSQLLNGNTSHILHPKKRFVKTDKLVTSISCNAIHDNTNQELGNGLGQGAENTQENQHKIRNHNNSSITNNQGLLTHIVGPISNSIKEKKHTNRCKILPSLKSFNFNQASGDRNATEFNCVAATQDSQSVVKEHSSNPHQQQTFLRGASKKCKKTSNKIFRVGSYRKKMVLAGNTSPTQPRVSQDREVPHVNGNEKVRCMNSLPEQFEENNLNSLSRQVEDDFFNGDLNFGLHRFVPMCCSIASATCTSCSRSMVNKPALQCQNCLITVHDELGCSGDSNVGPCCRVKPHGLSLNAINEEIKVALSQRMALRLSPCSEKGPYLPPPTPPVQAITISSLPVAVHSPAIEFEFRRVLSDTALLEKGRADAKSHMGNSSNLTTTTTYSCPVNVNTMHNRFPASSPPITASELIESTARSSSSVDKAWNPFDLLDKSIAYIDKSMIECVDGANNPSGPSSLNSSAAEGTLDSQYNAENENTENNLAPIYTDKMEDRDESAPTVSNLNLKMCDAMDGVIATPVSSLAPVSLSHDSESLSSSNLAREEVQPLRDSSVVESDAGSKHQGGIADFPGVARDAFLNFDGQNPANTDDWTAVRNEKKITKELTSKEIKKQDIIHELILTEKLHVQTLSIILKIYSYALSNTLNVDQSLVNLIFPRISNLYALHAAFYQNLKERQLQAPIVAAIGDILVEQFTGTNGDTMKREYGIFCSKHKTAIATYKNLVKSDKNVQNFMRDALLHPLCRRKSIPECILAVTQRITKYPIFIESIIKANKSKKIYSPDDELVTKALDGLKSVLTHVDEQINLKELEQRLAFICARIEAKSYAIYEGRRFGKGDLLISASASTNVENLEETSHSTKGRRLLFEGTNPLELTYAGLSGVAKNKQSCEVHALILTDLIVFLQESGGKYTFATADNMSAVLGLKKLLVREKAGDSTAFYIINCQPSAPEMYEVACESAKVKGQWLLALRKAISQASIKHINENEITKQASQIDEDIKKMNEKYAKVQKLLGEADKKDADIKAMLMQKNGILSMILDCLHKGTPQNQINENFAITPHLTSSDQQNTLSQSTSFIEIASQKSLGSAETESSKRQSLEASVLENLTWHLPVPRSSKLDSQPSGLLQLKEFLETLLVELYKSSLHNAPVHAINLNRSVSNVLEHRRDGSAWYLANPLALPPGTTQSFWPYSFSPGENQVGGGQFKRAETFSGFDTQPTPPNDCPPHLLQPSQPTLTAPGARNYLLKSLKFSKKSLEPGTREKVEEELPINSGGPTIAALDSSSYSASTTSCSSIPLSDSSKTSQISSPNSSAFTSQFYLPFNRAFKDQTYPHTAIYHTNLDDDTTFRIKTIQSFNYILGIVNQELTGQARLLAENADLQGRVNRYESEKTDRKSQMWHNQQLEELRNLQETVSKEKEALKRECEAEKAAILAEKRYVQAQTEQLMALKERLKADQELILTQKNTIQRYWAEVMDDRGRHSTPLSPQRTTANINPHPSEGGLGISCNSNAQHGRSKSYESSSYEAAILKASNAPHGSSNSTKGNSYPLDQLGEEALGSCANFPPHLISAVNERKLELLPTIPAVPLFKKNAHKIGPGNSKLLPLHLCSTTSLAGLPEANGPVVVGNGGNSNCKKGSQIVGGGHHHHSTSFLGSSSSFSFKKFQDWREASASNNQSTLSNGGAQPQGGRHSFFNAPPAGSKTQNPKSRHVTPDQFPTVTEVAATPCNGGLNHQMLPLKLASHAPGGPRRFLSHMDHASVLEVQNEEFNGNDIDPQQDPMSGRELSSDMISIKMSSSSPILQQGEGGINHNPNPISFKAQASSPTSNTAISISNPPHTNATPLTNNGQSSLYSPKLIQSIYYF